MTVNFLEASAGVRNAFLTDDEGKLSIQPRDNAHAVAAQSNAGGRQCQPFRAAVGGIRPAFDIPGLLDLLYRLVTGLPRCTEDFRQVGQALFAFTDQCDIGCESQPQIAVSALLLQGVHHAVLQMPRHPQQVLGESMAIP